MNLKKLVTISLIIFFVFILGVIIFGLYLRGTPKTLQNRVTVNFGTNQTITLNTAEIAKHNSANSCWMVIESKVYDVTTFISQHPGGPGTIIAYCGVEGTNGWNTKDRFPGRMHSAAAAFMLQNYLLGNLNQTINQTDFQNTQNKVSSGSAQVRTRQEDD